MTENIAPETDTNVTPEQNEDTTPETTEAPKLDRSKLSEMAAKILDKVTGPYERLVAIAEEQNKTGNTAELITEAIEKSRIKQVVELRQKVEEASEFILKAGKTMEDLVKPSLNLPSEEDLAKLDTEYKEHAAFISTYNGVFEAETEQEGEQHSVYDFLGALPGKKRGAKSGQGTGTVRPRVQKIEITTDIKGEEGYKVVDKDGKSTFGVLAQFIKSATDGGVDLPATDFSDAWVKQNGGKDWQDLKDITTFSVSATGDNEKSYRWMVRVTK